MTSVVVVTGVAGAGGLFQRLDRDLAGGRSFGYNGKLYSLYPV